MTWIVLQFVFLLLPVFLPVVLYRSRRPFMAAFYRAMTGNAKARKLYTQVLVVLLLLSTMSIRPDTPVSSGRCCPP